PIAAPASAIAGSPYPSSIDVSGLSGTVKRIRVRLNGVFDQFPDELEVLLVDPVGSSVMLVDGGGREADADGAVMTFRDGGVAPDKQFTSGVFVPFRAASTAADVLPA